MTDPQPTGPRERIEVLDALRGFALLGVLLVNVQYFVEPSWDALLQQTGARLSDQLALGFVDLFATSKFYPLFSFLFGYGAAQQMASAARRGESFPRFFAWRMAILLLIGGWHGVLIWDGDILATYALLGCVLLAFRTLSDRALLVSAALFAFAASALLASLLAGIDLGLVSGDAALALRERFAETAEPWGRVARQTLRVFSMFLLGFVAGRHALFHDQPSADTVARIRRVAAWGLGVGLGANGLWVALDRAADPSVLSWTWALSVAVLAGAGPVLAGGYAALFWWLFARPAWRPALARLAPVGRMALTNYVLQSLLCIGLVGELGLLREAGPFRPPFGLLLTAVVFAAQVVFSASWLARFRFGPLEWLWRSATYARAQPLRERD